MKDLTNVITAQPEAADTTAALEQLAAAHTHPLHRSLVLEAVSINLDIMEQLAAFGIPPSQIATVFETIARTARNAATVAERIAA